MNEKHFFDTIRSRLFLGNLKQSQVDGINRLLPVIKKAPLQEQAYILATVYHETARTMQPVEEYGKGARLDYGRWKTNSKGVRYCYKNSRRNTVYTEQESPHLYYGRGDVQLTWYDNYVRAGKELHAIGALDNPMSLVDNPSLALDPHLSAHIVYLGMKQGWFTGRKLSDFYANGRLNYTLCRKIVNGNDKASHIARIANIFEEALR